MMEKLSDIRNNELKILYKRRSVRDYSNKPIPKEILNEVIAAGQMSPVALGKFENYHIQVINSNKVKEIIERGVSEGSGREVHPLYNAPSMMVVAVKPNGDTIGNAEYASAAMIIHNMVLAAEALGLGACYIWGAIRSTQDNGEVQAAIDLPEGYHAVGSLVLGYPADEESISETREFKERFSVGFVEG